MKLRSFRELKKTMTTEELNKFCKKITEEYANSEEQYARTYFSTTYNITISCFYTIIEYAITRNLVEDVIVAKSMTKAMKNQNAHKNGAGISSIIKYARLYEKRYRYIAETMLKEEVKELATDFGENPNISKAEFASMYALPIKVIELVLQRAIIENIANEQEVDAIEKRSIQNADMKKVEYVREYFKMLREKRKMPLN